MYWLLQIASVLLGRWARYRLDATCQLKTESVAPINDHYIASSHKDSLFLVEPPQEVIYRGVPNHFMVPLNMAAKVLKGLFLWEVGDLPVLANMKVKVVPRRIPSVDAKLLYDGKRSE